MSPDAPARENTVGVALVVGAVVIGLLLLVRGYDSDGGLVDSGGNTATTTTVAITDTTVPGRDPAVIGVMVANASGVAGLAGRTRETLLGDGFTQVAVVDAPTSVPATQILYVPGAEGDAQAVATALGLDPASVQAIPEPPPVGLAGASVLVLAGPDLS